MNFDLKSYLAAERQRVNQALDRLLPSEAAYPAVIHQAMRYSVNAGGKRLRPILCLAAATAVGGDSEAVLPAACALECIHTYSLIHDDLPAMDNDDLRRGLPTNHKVYGEAMALLAGDALLTHAFVLLSGMKASLPVLQAVGELAGASGTEGMVGGQVVDVQWERGLMLADESATLEYIHQHKTGALITASLRIGAILGGADEAKLQALTAYGQQVGLAFQITDDLLDLAGDEQLMGKRVRKDANAGKLTYPRVFGAEAAKQKVSDLSSQALQSLQSFGPEAEPLRALVPYLMNRDH